MEDLNVTFSRKIRGLKQIEDEGRLEIEQERLAIESSDFSMEAISHLRIPRSEEEASQR